MRQIDAKSSKFRIVGAILTISKSTIGLFGIVMWSIALYGWHQLVFFELFPSFWLFAIILVSLYVVAAIVNYTNQKIPDAKTINHKGDGRAKPNANIAQDIASIPVKPILTQTFIESP